MPPSLPEAIGKYTIERFIESGGMGDVYLARDPALDRAVAIKFLREGFDNQEMRERFEREARAAGRLSHPNIVTIYEFGIFDGRPFIAMEFVRGEPLSKLIRRRESIPLVRKLEMMEGLCSGLAHAHKTGMVHRDIKPANLMVDDDGGPLKILDFGIVRMAGSGLTSHGVLVGTINYMSPEQITGRGTIDLRSDVFAVGAVLHEVFTYQRAFPGEMTDVLYKIVHAQPESAATLSPGLDPGIVRAIDQCLEKTPERRYQDLGVLRRELARIRQRLELEESETYGHTALTHAPAEGSGVARESSERLATGRRSRARRSRRRHHPRRRRPRRRRRRRPPIAPAGPRRPPPISRAPNGPRKKPVSSWNARPRSRRGSRPNASSKSGRSRNGRSGRGSPASGRRRNRRASSASRRSASGPNRRAPSRPGSSRRSRSRPAGAGAARQGAGRGSRTRARRARAARTGPPRGSARAREQAEKDRAEAQRKAEAEAKRQAEARREQRQRDLAQAQKDVAAGRFAEAAGLLRPWAAESAGDAAFATVLKQAEAGVAKLEAERRAQEELNRQIASASELVVRQDFAGASRVVQAILAAHPNHPAARNLEREIARGVEQRARAAAVVERARALFDASPGEAMELLERFTPAHGLVDSALAEMRERHAARERERLRREKQAQRQQQIAALTAQAGALVRNRAVQGGAAALLVLVVLDRLVELDLPAEADRAGDRRPGRGRVRRRRRRADSRPGPTAVTGPRPSRPPAETPRRRRPRSTPARRRRRQRRRSPAFRPSRPARPGHDQSEDRPASRRRTAARRARRLRAVSSRPLGPPGRGRRAAGGATPKPESRPGQRRRRTEPTPETPRDTAKVTAPPAGADLVEIAEAEIRRWIAEYTVAYQRQDEAQVRSMNPASTFRAAQYKPATVTFSNVDIQPREDGQSAVLQADVQYQFGFSRGDPQTTSAQIAWRMRKTPNGWVSRIGRSASCGASALGGAPSFVDVDGDEQRPAGDEEHDHRQDRGAVRVGERHRRREQQRPEDAGELLEHREEPEELGGPILRDQAGEHRSAQRLAAALHQADQRREHHEIARRRHAEAEHADHACRARASRGSPAWRRPSTPRAPNRNAAGTPMNCTSSSAPIRLP